MSGRPVIEISPGVAWGRPHIGGVGTVHIAGMVASGDGVDTACKEYGLTRHQVLLACWWEGLHGSYRKRWKAWAELAHPTLGGWVKLAGRDEPAGIDTVPDPPSREDAER